MNWSRREMSAESVASTNEPLGHSRLAADPSLSPSPSPLPLTSIIHNHHHHHQQQQQARAAMSTNDPSPLPHYATSLPAYLAQSLAASLTSGIAQQQQQHATTINQIDSSLAAQHQQQLSPLSTTSATTMSTITTTTVAAIQWQQQPLSKLLPILAAPSSSPLILEQQSSSFSEWWDEYWSRQPFPSGYTQSSITMLACFISTIIFLIVVGNLLVCIAIFTEKSLKPTQNWFIASLAVSDMLLGLVVMPFSLARELMGFWVFGPLWCDIHEAVDVLLTTASINTLCLISLDRYWSITQAVSYLKKRTPKRGAFMIAFVWVFSAAVSLPPLFGWKKQQVPIVVSSKPQIATNRTGPGGNGYGSSKRPNNSDDNASGASFIAVNDQGADYDSAESSSSAGETSRSNRRRRKERRHPPEFDELATPVSAIRRREAFADDPSAGEQFGLAATTPAPVATSQLSAADQQVALLSDYPTCQLSDDLGYVLYSALGSFYIPCAVMVFTYIKIFLAARSRARRAISKQQGRGGGGGADKRAASVAASAAAANRRTIAGAATKQQQLAVQQGCNASTISGQVTSCAGSLSHNDSSSNNNNNNHAHNDHGPLKAPVDRGSLPRAAAPIMKGGKIVIVERKKSLAATAALQQQASNSMNNSLAAIQAAVSATQAANDFTPGAGVAADKAATSASLSQEADPVRLSDHREQLGAQCTLTTSGVKQASPSALNSNSASNDSSMITVMHSSMVEVPPVTRFNFRDPSELPDAARAATSAGKQQLTRATSNAAADDEGARKAAAFLDAIRQVGAHEQHLVREVLEDDGSDGDDHGSKAATVPNIVLERRSTGQLEVGQNGHPLQHRVVDLSAGDEVINQSCCDSNNLNATSETCFMTIEEDSDMFESQTGRTITMVAGNASQRQANNLAKSQSTVVTMMPAAAAACQSHSTIVCTDAACQSAQHRSGATAAVPTCTTATTTTSARSASSYCGSSMTINDDDIENCDDHDEDQEDDGEGDEDDDEPLTDECNGYSCSVGYDHYCPEQDLSSTTCGHCQECEQVERQAAAEAAVAAAAAPIASSTASSNTRHLSIAEGLSPTRKQQARHHHHHHQRKPQLQQRKRPQLQQQQQDEPTEVQSITGDDNLSLTEYRSNDEDENSSIIGHDVLDATDSRRRDRDASESKKKQSAPGPANTERKKSSIGFRLSRLGSTAPLSNYSGGLIALAANTQQQQQQQPYGGGTRNLRALRQNFFLKLNQLTAKSATKQQESKSKKSSSTSPTGGKSSAQSSGTSYEPSVDYATTSNIHSFNEYPQETTIGDESEQHSSSEQARIVRQQSSEGHNKKSDDLMNHGPDNGRNEDRRVKRSLPIGAAAQSENVRFARHGDKTALLRRQPSTETGVDQQEEAGGKHQANQMVGRISSGLVSSSKSAAAIGAGAGLGKSQRFDLDNHLPHPHRNHHGGASVAISASAGGKKRPISGHSSTMISSSAGSGQPASQRAYLASDNERHKRKLAKARERRATLILGLIMAAFICSWLPFFTFYVLRAICSSCKENVSPRFEAFIFWMGYCNSAINPIIYTIFNRDFRKAFRKILFKCL